MASKTELFKFLKDANIDKTNLLDITKQDIDKISANRGIGFWGDLAGTVLREVKNSIKTGDITVSEYFDFGDSFIRPVYEGLQSGINSSPFFANAVGLQNFTPYLNLENPNLFQEGLRDVKLPLTSREFASLPKEVLPSSDELNQGLVPVDSLPAGAFERVAREERLSAEEAAKIQQPQPTDQTGLPAPLQPDLGRVITQPRAPEVPLPSPAGFTEELSKIGQLPPDQQEQAIVDLLASRRQQQQQPVIGVEDPNDPGRTIPIPIVGDVDDRVVPQTQDQSIIEAEARRQEEQRRREFEAIRALREQQITGLGEQLQTQRQQAFQDFIPQAAEQLQTKGLLQTSELENVLAREQGRLQTQSARALGAARLAGTDQDIAAIQDILAQRQGLQLSGLERAFSERDAKRQEQLARELNAPIPVQQSGSSGTLQGALGGAAAGASLGSVVPGIGTGIGAIVGGIGGGIAGDSK